jgi:hypothetical protein
VIDQKRVIGIWKRVTGLKESDIGKEKQPSNHCEKRIQRQVVASNSKKTKESQIGIKDR